MLCHDGFTDLLINPLLEISSNFVGLGIKNFLQRLVDILDPPFSAADKYLKYKNLDTLDQLGSRFFKSQIFRRNFRKNGKF